MVKDWIYFVSALASLVAFWFLAYKLGYKRGKKLSIKSNDAGAEQELFNKVYAPLRKLLIDTHITSGRVIMYPYFRTRLKRAYPYLRQGALKKFFKAISDKGISKEAFDVEFGHFPLQSIEKIIKDNIEWCDAKIVSLLQSALRAKYETYYREVDNLNEEDIKLIDHIHDEYNRLNKKLVLLGNAKK